MDKYIFYSEGSGVSDSYDTLKDCENEAYNTSIELNCEVAIYSYDDSMFPDGEFDVDDCTYIGYIEKK